MKTRLKLASLIFVLFSVCSLASCADMGGDFSNETDYGNGYEVNLIRSSRLMEYSSGVDVTDFYNKDSVNDFYTPLDYDEYRYLIISPTEYQEIDTIYFYVNLETNATLTVKLFLTNSLPTKITNLDDALSAYKTSLENGDDTFTYDYGDEPNSNCLCTTTRVLTANKWTDIGLTSFSDGTNKIKYIDVYSTNYLLIQFYNNVETGITFQKGMTYEQAKAQIENRKANRVSLKLTNIMIHSKNK